MMKRLYTLGVPVFPMFMATPALAENLYRQTPLQAPPTDWRRL